MEFNNHPEPIAIVGMACRLPGEVVSPSKLWDLLVQERSAQSDVPPNRFDVNSWYHPTKQRPGSINTRGGYFLSQDDSFRQFDASFFGINPKEAASMDPQQRKLLEVVYESFEAARARLEDVSGTNTACYVGNFTWDIGQMQARDVNHGAPYHMTGGGLTILSNRVNYVFNLKGPSMTIDTACSSTMYALHMACRSLQSGDCSAAVVAGTNLIFGIEQQIASVRLGVLSPTSVCHTFDESADGYARAEAVGSLYLKTLSQAIADKDPIRAVIRGTSINANGRSPGISHPSAADQELVIRQAYANAQLGFEQTGYFECHGTGTPVGDPLEVSAIGNVFGDVRTPESPLFMGSVKTNLGHGEAASAISSLIKTVLCLENGQIPATLGIKRLNPALNLRDGRLKVVQSLSPWPVSQSYRRASVNSFGYGGANAHAILDAVQSYLGELYQSIPAPMKLGAPSKGYYVLPFSAHSEQTLNRNISALSQSLKKGVHLPSLAYTLDSRRSNHSMRAFALVTGDSDGAQVADVLASDKLTFGTASAARPELGFVFTGQGAQWARMGQELVERYDVVRKTLQDLGAAITALQNAPEWDLLEALAQPPEKSRVNEAELSQPLTTAIQIAIVDLLRSWGVRPVAVVGHSSGEIAAAYCAGLLTAREAITIAYQRGAATVKSTQRGAMLAVGLGPDEALETIHDIPEIRIACYNSPDSVTLSGSEKAIEEARARFLTAGTFNRKLTTSGNAYHSHLMEEAGQHYEILLKESIPTLELTSTGDSSVTMFSSVTEKPVDTVDLAYWRQNLESPVRFDTATQQLLKSRSEVKVVIEIGPHSALAAPLKAIRTAVGYNPERLTYLSALKRNADSVECLLNLAGSLFLSGFPIPISTINSTSDVEGSRASFIRDLPTYEWEYDQDVMWAESRLSTDIRFRSYPHHDLLGSRLPGTSNVAPTWRNMISLDNVPWLRDHKVGDSVVFPAAGYVALALEAIIQIQGSTITTTADAYTLRDVKIKSAMLIKEGSDTEVLVDLHAVSGQQGAYGFVVSSVSNGTWTEHATGSVQVGNDCIIDGALRYDPTIVGGRGGVNKDSYDRRWYTAMNKVGLIYGESFKTLSDISASAENSQAAAQVPYNASEGQMSQQSRYAVHPTTLDACLQLSIIAAHKGKPEDLNKAYLPVSIKKLTVWPSKASPDIFLDAFGRGVRRGLRSIEASTGLTTADNQTILEAEVAFLSLETATDENEVKKMPQPYTRLIWKPDIDRLTNAQAKHLFSQTQADESTAKFYFSTLENLTQLAIRSVVERLPGDLQTDLLPGHMQKFLTWLRKEKLALSHKESDSLAGDKLIEKIDTIAKSLEQSVPEAAMVAQLNAKMPQIVSGTVGALDVMVENDLLSRIYEDGFGQTGAYARLTDVMTLVAHKDPRLHILELGAGTGGATKVMMKALNGDTPLPKYEMYDFTDVSKAFLGVAQDRFHAHRHMNFGILDIENDPAGQGFEEHSYDIVFASNVIHATSSVVSSLQNCRRLLKPDGKLMIVETTKDWQFTGFMLGALPGYWLGADDGRPGSPFLSKARWNQVLLDAGFSGVDIVLDDYAEPASCTTLIVARNTSGDSRADANGNNNSQDTNGSIVNGLSKDGTNGVNGHGANGVNGHGANGVNGHEANGVNGHRSVSDINAVKPPMITLIYRREPQPFQDAIERKYAQLGFSTRSMALEDVPKSLERDSRTIMLAELEGPLLAEMAAAEMAAIQRYTQLANTSIWVTDGGVLQGQDPRKSLIFGLAKAIMTEQPSFHLCSVDIDLCNENSDLSDSVLLLVDTEIAFHRDPNADMDTELVEKDGLVYISRYVSDYVENSNFERYLALEPTIANIPQGDDAYALRFGKVSKMESFYFDKQNLRPLAQDEVLVDVDATPLNPLSIDALKGKLSSLSFGMNVAGTVRAVGPTASKLKAGDYVCCMYPHHFDTAVIVNESHCEILPAHKSVEDMLGQIHPLVTSLHVASLLRLSQGDQVLIDCKQAHLAYIFAQVALLRTAAVHVTFHSDASLAILRQLGSQIQLVNREGGLRKTLSNTFFDAVFTDATDEFQLLSAVIQPGGHIVALGNSVPTGMINAAASFLSKGVTIAMFDPMDGFAKAATRPSGAVSVQGSRSTFPGPMPPRGLLAEAVDLLSRGIIRSVPCMHFDLARLPEAISKVSQDDFVGSAVLTRTPDTKVPVYEAVTPLTFDSEASYFLVGCLGGLGRSLTAWMVSRGARHFVFLSRSGTDKREAAELIDELHELSRSKYPGLSVQVVRGDVSVREDVRRAISHATKPIKGVVQAAMVLKDKLFSEMSLDDFTRVIHPKLLGTQHLHDLLLDRDLDFFVMTSSVLGAIGAAMQSNYSAANAYLDHMARHRRALGLQAMSIALGMVVDVGHVEEHPEVEKALKRNGLYGIAVDEYLANMELACRRRPVLDDADAAPPYRYDPSAAAHIVTGMDPTRLSRAGGKSLWLKDNRLRNIVVGLGEAAGEEERGGESAGGVNTAELLERARAEGGAAAVKGVVLSVVLARFSKLVLLPVEKIDPAKALAYYGMDSMISAELKSWAWREFEVDLPFLGLLDQGLTFDLLANQVVEMLDGKAAE